MKRKHIISLIFIIISIILLAVILFNIKNDKKSTSGDYIAVMIEKDKGLYEKWNEDVWPQGYILNKMRSICEKETDLGWDNVNKQVILDTKKSNKCTIYFDKITPTTDLSGNNYSCEFKNGTTIKLDDQDSYGLYFDGEDDYVDVANLPATIDWASGFTVEFEAKWKSFNHYSRIFDFATAPKTNSLHLTNVASTSQFRVQYFDNGYSSSIYLDTNKKYRIKVVLEKISNDNNYKITIFIDGIKMDEYSSNGTVNNIERTYNYIGKSNWETDKYFNGYIYFFKIIDSTGAVILWYDFTNQN